MNNLLKAIIGNSKKEGFDSLLPYLGFFEDGIMVLKSGGICACFEIYGKDKSSCSDAEIGLNSMRVNNYLKDFGDGWMLHIDTIRIESNYYPTEEENYFPNPVSALIDASRRSKFAFEGNVFENKYYLTITYTSPSLLTPKMQNMLEMMGVKNKENKLDLSFIKEGKLEVFKSKIREFQNKIHGEIFLRSLKSEEILSYFHQCITGLNQQISLPSIPLYLDTYLSSKDFIGGIKPKIGSKHIRVVSIGMFPDPLRANFLDDLSLLPFELRVSLRFIHLDPARSKKYIEDIRKEWDQSKLDFKAMITEKMGSASSTIFASGDAIDMSHDADAAVGETQRNDVGFGFATVTVILMDEDEKLLQEKVDEVVRSIAKMNAPFLVEEYNAVQAYLGSLPAIGYTNVRKPLVTTHNFAHLMPLCSIWSGPDHHPNPKYVEWVDQYREKKGGKVPPLLYGATAGNCPFRVSLHVSDVGHTLIIGPTGTGKSALLGLIASQAQRYPDMQVFIFDKKYSQFVLSQAVDGAHFDLAADDSKFSFCPLAHLETPEQRNWAKEWIEMLVELQTNAPISVAERGIISNTIELFAATRKTTESRTLDDFMRSLANAELSRKLEFYADDYGYLFNGDKDEISKNNFCVFEMDHLISKGKNVVIPALSYIFNMIERRLDGRPSYIIIDEAWTFLNHPAFTAKINEWLRELRKKRCSVIFATQSLTDITESKTLFNPIIDSCQTKIFLPNPNALETDSIYATYQMFGLNDNEIQIIANAKKKLHYYFKSTEGSRLFEILLDDLSLAFVGVADAIPISQVKILMAEDSENWVSEWLRLRNVSPKFIEYFKFLKEEMEEKKKQKSKEKILEDSDFYVKSEQYSRYLDFSPEFVAKVKKFAAEKQDNNSQDCQ